MQVIDKDGREFLNNAPAGRYDAIFLDAFGSLFSVPYQLTTKEAVERMRRTLNDHGVILANIGSSITGDAGHFLRAEIATYRTVFPQVYIFKVRSDKKDSDLQNIVLVALKSDKPAELRSPDAHLNELLTHVYTAPLEITEPILTDDLAPVEFYNSVAQRIYLADRR
jgi:spermidine synthase